MKNESESSEYKIALFLSTSEVMKVESLCMRASLNVKLIPVPKQVSSDCGICIRFFSKDYDTFMEIIEGKALPQRIIDWPVVK